MAFILKRSQVPSRQQGEHGLILASEFSWLLDMGGTLPFPHTPIFSQLQADLGESYPQVVRIALVAYP